MIIIKNDNNLYDLLQNNTNNYNKSNTYPNNKYFNFSYENSNLTYEYIIITSKEFVNSCFQLLISHKSQYINATIVTVDDILINSSFWVNGTYGDATNESNGNPYIQNDEEVTKNYDLFNDTTAKIRNFIRFAHHKLKTQYVLLGGDVELIPVKRLYVNISGWDAGLLFNRNIEAWIPSDLYYGALDGTWNKDFDENFGEMNEADLIAEVFIGRAPVDGKSDIATFVKKVISYETSIKPKDILLHQSNLTPFKKPDTSIIPEACAKLIPDSYKIHRLYQKNELITKEKWANSFKEPDKLLILHIGNGYFFGPTESWYQLYYNIFGREKFSNSDIGYLNNKFYPIHISISCMNGNFALTDCLAEELLLWSNGGPSACFFNSEVGCVKKENSLKYSGEYIERLFYEIFVNETKNLGRVNQFAKEYFAIASNEDPNYRWVYYETNLLGDPETPVFDIRTKLPTPEIYVNDDAVPPYNGTIEHPFKYIQDGINASLDNEIVYVYNGTYMENVIIDKTIELIGENKNSTIIDGGENENTITFKTNSSVISNFTILHNNTNKSKNDFVGIYIQQNCWGNTIYNNIIIKNGKSGITVNDSCRTMINNNIITLNGIGICLTKDINGLYQKSIVITCSNKIEYNEISLNGLYGIYIKSVLNNYIRNNNFINNTGKDAYFFLSRNNDWNGNYWNESRTEPKKISGIWGPLFPPIIDFSDGIIFPQICISIHYKCGISN